MNGTAASVSSDLGAAYVELREAISAAQAALGDGDFAKRVVSRAAVEVFGYRYGHRSPAYSQFSAPLVCSAPQLRKAARDIQAVFRVRAELVTHRGRVEPRQFGFAGDSPGDLVLRGASLLFEVPSASVMLACIDQVSGAPGAGVERWAVLVFEDANAFSASFGLKRPTVSTSYTKSRDAAIKSLLRIAKESLGVELEEAG